MTARERDHVNSLIGELVYARVLLALEREQLRRRDQTLKERLDSLLTELPSGQRKEVCESALERAWARAARDVREDEDPEDAEIRSSGDGSGDLAA